MFNQDKIFLRFIFFASAILINLFCIFSRIIESNNKQFTQTQVLYKYEFLFIVATAIKTIIICKFILFKHFTFLYWGGVFVNVIIIFTSEVVLQNEQLSQKELFSFFRCYLINSLFFLYELNLLTNKINLFE